MAFEAKSTFWPRAGTSQIRRREGLCRSSLICRLGAKHRPVRGSIPWVGGWRFRQAISIRPIAYSLPALRACAVDDPTKCHAFCAQIRQGLPDASGGPSVSRLNQVVLRVCRQYFPPGQGRPKPLLPNSVQAAVDRMWKPFRVWRNAHRYNPQRHRLFQVWRKYA